MLCQASQATKIRFIVDPVSAWGIQEKHFILSKLKYIRIYPIRPVYVNRILICSLEA